MRITSSTRRTAALMAASTIGLSTLVLGVTGVASAGVDFGDFTFSTDANDHADQTITPGGTLTVPAGYCSIDWFVQGAAGGDSDASGGGEGATLEGTTTLDRSATSFGIFPGTMGQDGGDGGAGGTNGRNGDGGAAGSDDGAGMLGGGGGAASTVVHAASVFLRAPGGDGADGDNGSGAGAGGGAQQLQSGVTATGTDYADGVIAGEVHACPEAPQVNWVEGGDHSLDFQLDSGFLPDGVDITALQYSLDGGAWTAVSSPDVFGNQYEGSITGLTTAQQYSVRFRFTTTGDVSNVSDAETATPRLPAPGNVAAVVGPSSITVSWQPPAGNTSPITDYTASASISGAQSGGEDTPSCTTTTLSCTIVVPAGNAYDVAVTANDAQKGVWSEVVTTATVPAPSAPATVPTGNGSLDTPSGAPSGLAQGSTVTLTGSGYAPNSTVSLYIYSTPTLLGTVVTNASGSFSHPVTIPASLAPGAHHLVAAGLDPSGNPRYLTSAVTVAQATGTLAWTGFETLPAVGVGVLIVALGAGLIVVGRRRRTA